MESFENFDLSKLKGVVFSGKDFKIVDGKNDKTMLNKKRNRSKNKSERERIAKNSLEKNALFKYFFGLVSDCFEKQEDGIQRNIGNRKLYMEEYIKKMKFALEVKKEEVKRKIANLSRRASILDRKIQRAQKDKHGDIRNIEIDEECLSKLKRELSKMREELLKLENVSDVSNGNLSFKPTNEAGYNMDYPKFENGMSNLGENSEYGIQSVWLNIWLNGISKNDSNVIKKTGEDKDQQPNGRNHPDPEL